jgi:hypothetical protein
MKELPIACELTPAELDVRREELLADLLALAQDVGTREPQFQTTNQLTARLAKEHGVDAEAILVEGDHESSVAPAVKQSIAFFQKK